MVSFIELRKPVRVKSILSGRKIGNSFGYIKFEMPIAQLRGDSSGQLAIRVQSSRM